MPSIRFTSSNEAVSSSKTSRPIASSTSFAASHITGRDQRKDQWRTEYNRKDWFLNFT
jgi:hypothetical protein